ncbi:proteasome subunit beta type-2-like [Aricia agestis]|uniref:proteasome subunit beta type-2-like n=1 Tax=Aricia agestis TaxID=91739 RepID=UPI001C2094F4|nr:proteasome subunit beta type-2-like [Aricia agestis]
MDFRGSQCLLGMQCDHFVMIAADKTNTQSIFISDQDSDKIHALSDNLMMGVIGDQGSVAQLCQYIRGNMELYRKRNSYGLDMAAGVHFIRRTLSESLRSPAPILVNSLVGGFDRTGPSLYTMDLLAARVRAKYAAQGVAGYLCISILAKDHKPNLSIYRAHLVIQSCVREIHKRYILNLPAFGVKAITRRGVMVLPDITAATLA